MNESQMPHVLILGGGFAGLWATRALKHAPVRITLRPPRASSAV